MTLEDEIRQTLNKHSVENGSNTPDFILAEYLLRCLTAFDIAVAARTKWYGLNVNQEHETPPQTPHDRFVQRDRQETEEPERENSDSDYVPDRV